MQLRAAFPGELFGSGEGSLAQLEPNRLVLEKLPESHRDVRLPWFGVRNRIATDLWQRQATRREHRGTTGHRLENGKAETLTQTRISDDRRPTKKRGKSVKKQVAGAQHAQSVRHICYRCGNGIVPRLSTGYDQRTGRRETIHRTNPSADESGHVSS
jgi:hypothetical protein